jgi:signal transduction histidine kinase
MKQRTASRLAWTLGVAAAGVVPVYVAFGLALGSFDDAPLLVPVVLGTLAMVAVGVLIASRTGNPIGWIYLLIPLSFGVSSIAQAFADYGIPRGAGYARAAYWLSQWPFFASLVLLIGVFFLFPTGRLTSPRWRWPWRAYVAAGAVTVVGFAFLPYEYEADNGAVLTNPVGIEPLHGVLGAILAVAGITLLATAFLSFGSLVGRYRRAEQEERQQLRWLFTVGAIAAVALTLLLVVGLLAEGRGIRTLDLIGDGLMVVLVTTVVLGIPVATGVAILKYRLYDLDRFVRKTVVIAVLALFIATGYAAIVAVGSLALGGGNVVVSFVAATVLAVGFQPARDRARRVADRFVYGKRATPYEVLTAFGDRVSEAYSPDEVLPRMVQVLAQGTGAEAARVWLRVGGELSPAASWPPNARSVRSLPMVGENLPELGDEHAFPVRHHGEMLGAVTLSFPPSDPITPAKSRLVEDLAAQAGLVLRNARLIEELRASRQRLVAAQDEERRRIERNLHDGAQQQLVAMSIKLGLAERLVRTDPDTTTSILAEVRSESSEALENLRDLARGIYPPLLADQGLGAALAAQARKSPVPVDVSSDGIGRFPREVEAAVYFSTLEALQNVAKYAGASKATIGLARSDGHLRFSVHDDGRGFDPDVTSFGTGLQGMSDRLDAIGGTLSVRSAVGEGTTIRGSVPVSSASS